MSKDELKEISSGDGWWGKWRGVQAWEFTIELPINVGLIGFKILIENNAFVLDALTKLSGLIVTYIICRAALIGVHIWKGSEERLQAISSLMEDKKDA